MLSYATLRHFGSGLRPVAMVIGRRKLAGLLKPMTYYDVVISAGALRRARLPNMGVASS